MGPYVWKFIYTGTNGKEFQEVGKVNYNKTDDLLMCKQLKQYKHVF